MLGTEVVSVEHQQRLDMKITECTSEDKIKTIEMRWRERHRGTQDVIVLFKMNNNNKLGYKAPYILTRLGQLLFDLFTELS